MHLRLPLLLLFMFVHLEHNTKRQTQYTVPRLATSLHKISKRTNYLHTIDTTTPMNAPTLNPIIFFSFWAAELEFEPDGDDG